jgi:hypothetical protein
MPDRDAPVCVIAMAEMRNQAARHVDQQPRLVLLQQVVRRVGHAGVVPQRPEVIDDRRCVSDDGLDGVSVRVIDLETRMLLPERPQVLTCGWPRQVELDVRLLAQGWCSIGWSCCTNIQ